VVALVKWLHRDALIKRLDAEIDAEAEGKAAPTPAASFRRVMRAGRLRGGICGRDRRPGRRGEHDPDQRRRSTAAKNDVWHPFAKSKWAQSRLSFSAWL
jgi:hypothetical protein